MAEIKLPCGRIAVVDDADHARLAAFRWHIQVNGRRSYALRRTGGVVTLMHREVIAADKGQLVDHINGDTLDNRRQNLRIATAKQNARNSAAKGAVPLVGVTRQGKAFLANIAPNGMQIRLGSYSTAEQAAAVYNAAASRCYGEFARLNAVPADAAGLEEAIQRKRDTIKRLLKEIEELSHG